MTHLWLDEPITVTVDDSGKPTQFIWQEHRYLVKAILREWKLETDWWRADGSIERLYWLVFTQPQMVCTIYHDELEGTWRFRRRYD